MGQFIGRTGEDFEDNIDEKSVGGEFTLFELNKLIKSGNHSTIDELLDTFYISCVNKNSASFFGCFLDSNSRLLGTDMKESWSVAEFYEFSKPHFGHRPLHEYARPYFHHRTPRQGGRSYC